MLLTLKCPACESGLPLAAAAAPSEVTCGRCGQAIPLSMSDDLRADRAVDTCPVCSGRDFYLRKDFDPKFGLTVVVIGAVISGTFYFFGLDLIAYGVLAMVALIDLFVYRRLGDLSVCYRCHTEFRGRYARTASHFDLHTADVLELEYQRTVYKNRG